MCNEKVEIGMREDIKSKFNTAINIISTILISLFEYLIALALVSPLTGTLLAFFDISWRWRTVIPILGIAMLVAIVLHKCHLFTIDGWRELLAVLIIIMVSFGIYQQYSPVLEMRQDPAVYMYRALNLVNYGHTYQPMDKYVELTDRMESAYASIQNGTYLSDGKLYTDFYPGGSFLYAIIGKIYKPFIFYGQTLIMLLVAWVLYFAIKTVANKKDIIMGILCSLLFIVSPLIVWFGRGSFTEPIALFFYLFLVVAISKTEFKSIQWVSILILTLCASYTARIDYISLLILGAFFITYYSRKIGLIYGICALVNIHFIQSTYNFYYYRITNNDLTMLKYGDVYIILAILIGAIVGKWGKTLFEKMLYAKWVKITALAIGALLALLMFYDNYAAINGYSYAVIHNQYMRTYEESILDLLFLVFPSIVIVCGLLGMHTFFDKKYNIVFTVFVFGSFVAYSYLFFGAGNSPQLYWLLRRYMNVLLPSILLGFVSLLQKIDKRVGQIFCLVCLTLSINLLWNSNQIVNYQNLDKDVAKMDLELREEGYDTVYYTSEMKTAISPLFSYSGLEFVPVADDDFQSFVDYITENDNTSTVLITDLDVGFESEEEYEINYITMGENYGSIPQIAYDHVAQWLAYSPDILGAMNEIYPGVYTKKALGIGEDGWTSVYSMLDVYGHNSHYNELVIEMRDYYNYCLESAGEDFGIKLIINRQYTLKPTKIEENCIYFDVSTISEGITKIQILCPTFNLEELGLGEDGRDLGININRIYYQ